MSYEYLEDIATADVAFRAKGRSLEDLFASAVDATLNAMVEDVENIKKDLSEQITISSDTTEMLLFQLLQEIIFFKDSKELLLRLEKSEINKQEGVFVMNAKLYGEEINHKKHKCNTDVKAVTLHRFSVKAVNEGWEAIVVLDV